MSLNFGRELFPPARELIQSFDFVDTVQGQGFIEYFPLGARDSTGSIEKALFSTRRRTSEGSVNATESGATTGFELIESFDYDILVNNGFTVKGKGHVQFIFTWADNGAGGNQCRIVAKLKKVSTSTTTIATGQLQDITNNTAESGAAIILEATQTKFNKDDKLRLTIEVFMNRTSGTDQGSVTIFTDPLDATNDKDMSVIVPFKLIT